MTFSPLINGTVPHHGKFSSRAGSPIVRVLPHHHAATGLAGLNRLTDPGQQASANYIIMSNGQIFGQVPEEYRAWTSGSHEADAPSITFEIQNSGGQINGNDNDSGSWLISSAAYNSVVRLIADIAKRYKWGGVGAYNVRGHREFFPTACPGGYLWSKLPAIRAAAHGQATNTLVVSNVPGPKTPSIAGKTIWTLAQEVIKGVYGTGDVRKKALGTKYAAVQAEVNRQLAAPKAKLPTTSQKTVAQLVDEVLAGVHGSGDQRKKSLGARFDEVQAAVNKRLGVGGGPNIAQLADAVLRGEYGDGEVRKARLGSYYNAVQKEINRRYGVG